MKIATSSAKFAGYLGHHLLAHGHIPSPNGAVWG